MFIVIVSSTAYGQDSAIKIDEVNYVNCEHQRSVIDILLIVLKNSPDSNGVIVIHGSDDNPVFSYKQKLTISNHIEFRSVNNWLDPNRIELILGESKPEPTLELWKVPKNGQADLDGHPWDHKLPDLKVPLLIHQETWTDGIGCGQYIPTMKFYSEFLLANEWLVLRIVIKDQTLSKYKKVKARITKELVKKYVVENNRLEFEFVQNEDPDVEYWYLKKISKNPVAIARGSDHRQLTTDNYRPVLACERRIAWRRTASETLRFFESAARSRSCSRERIVSTFAIGVRGLRASVCITE